MTIRRYTIEQLLHLRESPLVQKPDNLPAIEQWIDESQQQTQQQKDVNAKRQPAQRTAGDASPMGNFSTGQRPSLMQTRMPSSRGGDDVSLGPPKTVFASSRTSSRLADVPTTAESLTNDEPDSARGNRLYGDKQTNRRGQNDGEARYNRESWTSARERRAQGGEDDALQSGDRTNKYGRRDREKDHDGDRRTTFGGERSDNRWGQRDDRRPNGGERQGGWREREREKRDRDWDRGGHVDKEPEWMDDPAPKQEDDFGMMSMPKNQEDFEKWKREQHAQHGRNKTSTDQPATATLEPTVVAQEAPPAKTIAPLKIEGVTDKPFGGWGESRRVETPSETTGAPAKPTSTKPKTSRFMPMFKKDEPREEPPAETNAAPILMQAANGSAEDKEGFQRILQMLGGTGISQSQASTPNEPMSPGRQGGAKPKSRFTGFFDQAPKSPETSQATQQTPFQPMENQLFPSGRGNMPDSAPPGLGPRMPENQQNDATRPQATGGVALPDAGVGREPRPQSKGNEHLLHDPPSRGASTPDINIQHLLASQRNQRQGQDKNQEFLLNLLQQKGASRPPSQQARPDGNFPIWADQAQGPETHAPRPRVPPSASLFEDQLLRSQQDQPQMQGPDAAQRRPAQRPPPGFMDEQAFFMQQQQQRRNFPEPPQQHMPRMNGHPNLPPGMQMPPPGPPFPPELLQSQGGPQQGPPPGFNPHMPRHPPGFHPNMFPQQHQPPREPPGFGGNGMMPPNSPPGAPPGFFPGPPNMPPGFMQMRSPPNGGIPVGASGMPGNGRGFEGYDAQGQRR